MISAPQCDITITVSIIAWHLCHIGNKKLSGFFFFLIWLKILCSEVFTLLLSAFISSSDKFCKALNIISTLCNMVPPLKIFLVVTHGTVLRAFWMAKSLLIFSLPLHSFPSLLAESRSMFTSYISGCSCCEPSCLVELYYFGILALYLARVASSSIHVPLMRRVIQSPLK